MYCQFPTAFALPFSDSVSRVCLPQDPRQTVDAATFSLAETVKYYFQNVDLDVKFLENAIQLS